MILVLGIESQAVHDPDTDYHFYGSASGPLSTPSAPSTLLTRLAEQPASAALFLISRPNQDNVRLFFGSRVPIYDPLTKASDFDSD